MRARVRSVVEIAASVAVDCQFEASEGMWNRVRVPDQPVSVFADNNAVSSGGKLTHIPELQCCYACAVPVDYMSARCSLQRFY